MTDGPTDTTPTTQATPPTPESTPAKPVPGLLTIRDVANRWGLHWETVKMKFKTGKVKGAFKLGRSWRIYLRDVVAYELSLRKASIEASATKQSTSDETNRQAAASSSVGHQGRGA